MSRKQVIVVPSSDPVADVVFLVDRFCGIFDVVDEYTLQTKCSVLILIETEDAVLSKPVIVWATDIAFPTTRFGASQTLITLDALQFCQFALPSGTALLQLPLETSSSGHRQLADFIRGGLVFKAPAQHTGDPSSRPLPERLVLPRFPTLDVRLLDADGSYSPFPLNSPVPIPVETDLFRGRMLVLLRPPHPAQDDPYWNERIFSRRQRRCVIQLQGKFIRQPQGVVYAGGQVSDPMKLGLITRGVCSVLLRLIETFQKNVHYSYGTSTESAHIVAPAHSFFERVVATPAGGTPPPMEDTFPETPAAMAQRKAATEFPWNTTDTYSFSFFSMYIDLVRWKLVSIPATGDLRLQTFWGSSSLNICMYEKTGNTTQHLDKENNYAFSIRAQYLGDKPDSDINESRRGGEGSDTESVTFFPWAEHKREPSVASVPEIPSPERDILRSESQVFSSLDLSSLSPVQYRDEMTLKEEEENELNFFDAEQGRDHRTTRDIESVDSQELLRLADLVCPFWVEKHQGNSTVTLLAINKDSETTFRRSRSCEDLVLNEMSQELSKKVKQGSPRLSSLERLRRSVGIALSDPGMSASTFEAINAFFRDEENRAKFLAEEMVPKNETRKLAGTLGRALSDRHWVEEWATVSKDNQSLLFFRSAERRRHHFQVKLSTISQIDELSSSWAPKTFGFYAMALTTLGRTLYLMMASKAKRDTWVEGLRDLVVRASAHEENGTTLESNVLRLYDMESIASEYLHNSTMWKCKNRRILNCGIFHFRQGDDFSMTSCDAVAMSQEALHSIIGLQTEGSDDAQRRRSFLDKAARLKAVSLEGLDEDAKLVFFINLYHVMVSHAFLILGPPDSSLKWFKYFNNIAYQVSDDVFSLTELEHCILRANMTYPSQLFSKFVIPKTKFRCALDSTNDYRINFALNCGSTSIPRTIHVFDTDMLEHQLDEASRMYLESTTSRMTSSGTVILNVPRVVQWFAEDFGDDQVSRLNSIRPFLPKNVGEEIDRARRCELKYQPFCFECRPVTIHTPSIASKNNSSSST